MFEPIVLVSDSRFRRSISRASSIEVGTIPIRTLMMMNTVTRMKVTK